MNQLNTVFGAVNLVAQTVQNLKKTGTDADDSVSAVPPSRSQTLDTKEADGKWTLTFTLSAVDQMFGGTVPAPAGPGFAIPVAIPDRGEILQDAAYSGSNAWPGAVPVYNDEPPTPEEREMVSSLCAATVGALLGAPNQLTAVAALIACVGYAIQNADQGGWQAFGSYENTWSNSRWAGRLLGLSVCSTYTGCTDIFSITSSSGIGQVIRTAAGYGNIAKEGYYEQRQKYQEMDANNRADAWAAHNEFQETAGGSDARIAVAVELLDGLSQIQTPVLPIADDVFYDVTGQRLIFECGDLCPSSTVVEITSPGTATLTVGEEVTYDFAGTQDGAVVRILGIPLTGFTLDGEFSGAQDKTS